MNSYLMNTIANESRQFIRDNNLSEKEAELYMAMRWYEISKYSGVQFQTPAIWAKFMSPT